MENLKEVLEKLEVLDMHVHVIPSEGYPGANAPYAMMPSPTHFVMHGKRIIHVGDVRSIRSFVLRQ